MKGNIYLVRIVNLETGEKFLKVGIAKYRKGKNQKGILQRGNNPDNYAPNTVNHFIRQWEGEYEDCRKIEWMLHEMFKDDKYLPKIKFGGYTECFIPNSKIGTWFPKKRETAEDWINKHQNLNFNES